MNWYQELPGTSSIRNKPPKVMENSDPPRSLTENGGALTYIAIPLRMSFDSPNNSDKIVASLQTNIL